MVKAKNKHKREALRYFYEMRLKEKKMKIFIYIRKA